MRPCPPTDRHATFHPFPHRVPVYQPGLQLARPVRQLQQRHLVSEPLQRVRSFGHRAARRRPPAPPAAAARAAAELHLQRLRRAHPPGEQDPTSLQRVREEQPAAARAAPAQPLHSAADGPAGPAAQTSPDPHGQHEAGRDRRPSGAKTETPAQEGVPAIGVCLGEIIIIKKNTHPHTLAYFALFYSALTFHVILSSAFPTLPIKEAGSAI